MRRHLHRFPELSNAERGTQRFLLDRLKAAGIGDALLAAGYGLLVDVRGQAAPSDRVVGIRADIDALPITEVSGEAFSSENFDVMYACGHDAHTAMGLAVAMTLHHRRADFAVTVRIIFQPAVEAEPLGGRRIVEAGVLDVASVRGVCVDPYIPTGTIAVGEGPYTLASDIFIIRVLDAPRRLRNRPKGSMRSWSHARSLANCRRSSHARSMLTTRSSFR